jgi:hypothetical protein
MEADTYESGYKAAILRVKIMAGYYGLDEAQTDALVAELEADLLSRR